MLPKRVRATSNHQSCLANSDESTYIQGDTSELGGSCASFNRSVLI